MSEPYWGFINEDYGPYPGWCYMRPDGPSDYYPADPHGWISVDHDPPTYGKYLICGGDSFWGPKYWNEQVWMSTYPVEYWKPVVLPEKEDPDRFFAQHPNDRPITEIVDSKTDCVIGEYPRVGFEFIINNLNEHAIK